MFELSFKRKRTYVSSSSYALYLVELKASMITFLAVRKFAD
jgi:hypothetical protein